VNHDRETRYRNSDFIVKCVLERERGRVITFSINNDWHTGLIFALHRSFYVFFCTFRDWLPYVTVWYTRSTRRLKRQTEQPVVLHFPLLFQANRHSLKRMLRQFAIK